MSAPGLAQGILGNCCFTDVHSAKNITWRQTLQLVSKKTTACKIAQNLKTLKNISVHFREFLIMPRKKEKNGWEHKI